MGTSQRVSRGFPWPWVAAFTALIFFTSPSIGDEQITLACSGKHTIYLGDSGTHVAGVSVIVDLDRGVVRTPLGTLPIVLVNENTISFQSGAASGSIDRIGGQAVFSRYDNPESGHLEQYVLLCSKAARLF